jgi:hypothetical protein
MNSRPGLRLGAWYAVWCGRVKCYLYYGTGSWIQPEATLPPIRPSCSSIRETKRAEDDVLR